MWRFGQMTFGNFFSAKQRFGQISIYNSQNDVRANDVSGKNDVQLNDDSGKLRSAERRFGKTKFGWTTIRKNGIQLNNDSEKCRSALWSFANSQIRPCDDSVKWLSAIFFRQNNDSAKFQFTIRKMMFGQMMFREKTTFGWTTIRKNDVQLNDDSEKQRSAERRFGKMTFGWTTIRKNVVQHYEVSLIRRFGHVKIRSNDFRPFFFGKTTRQNFNAKLQIAKLQIVKLPLSVTSSLYFNLLLVLKYLPSRDKN